MSKVYVTQPAMRRDATGAQRPLISPHHFHDYGEAVYLLADGQIGSSGQLAWDTLQSRLDETQFDPQTDYLIISGDFTLGALAYHAMMLRGRCRLLRWDGKFKRYDVVDVNDDEATTQSTFIDGNRA